MKVQGVNDNPHHDDRAGLETPAPPVEYLAPLQRMSEALEAKRWICGLAETIADSLPEPSSLLCLRAAAMIRNDLPVYHADAGQCLLPQLRIRHADAGWITLMLRQIEADHNQLEIYTDEAADLLERIGTGHATLQERNVAGYALRCFFEGLRRHVSWEQNVILPLASDSLTMDDMLIIASGMERNREAPPRGSVLGGSDQTD
jgi:hypothetical protein